METLEKRLTPSKSSNYLNMQNAWSMDFISWLLTHVNLLEFTLLASLAEMAAVGAEEIMKGMSQYHQWVI